MEYAKIRVGMNISSKLIVNLGSSAAVHRRCSSDTKLSRLPKAKKIDQGFRHPYLETSDKQNIFVL